MGAVKHDAAFARKVGIPQKVGRDFIAADAGGEWDRGHYHEVHKKAKPRGKWHNQHSGHPRGA
jgi:hypothetical protein